jgi:hypothetical protein
VGNLRCKPRDGFAEAIRVQRNFLNALQRGYVSDANFVITLTRGIRGFFVDIFLLFVFSLFFFDASRFWFARRYAL